jgi:hypothetical protein
MPSTHLAEIEWSSGQVEIGLPAVERTIDPAWFWDDMPRSTEGWSLACEFAPPPSQQGNPSRASVRFVVDAAPHDRLRPGTLLRMFERATRSYATVRILN